MDGVIQGAEVHGWTPGGRMVWNKARGALRRQILPEDTGPSRPWEGLCLYSKISGSQ